MHETPSKTRLRSKKLASAVLMACALSVAFPPAQAASWDMQWTTLSGSGGGPRGSGDALYGGQSVSRGNRTALALGLSAAEAPVAPAVAFAGNVGVALARYNPYTKQGRIDVYRFQDTGAGGVMQHAVFAPRHGQAWVAARAYISPASYATGSIPGVNPFASFGGGDTFEGISLAGMKVALGHAMRLSGAGAGLLAMPDTRLSQRTRRRKSLFKKTVETWIYGHIKTRWFMAFPGDGLQPSLWSDMAAICATSPGAGSCPSYATAVSGAIFQEVEGGGLDSVEVDYLLEYQKKSGLTVLGGMLLGGLLGPLVGAPAGGGLLGGWYADRNSPKLNTQVSDNSNVFSEPVYVQKPNGGVQGGSVGTGVLFPNATSGSTSTAIASGAALPSPSKYQQMVISRIPPVNTPVDAGAGTLKGFTAAATGPNGIVPIGGQYVEANYVQYVRDANGNVIRDQAGR